MGRFSEKHLVKDHAHRPDITLGGVGASVKDLRAHVHGAAHQRLVNLIKLRPFLIVFSKPKISNLVCFMLDENIGRFQIPVDNRMLMQISVAPDKLFHDNNTLRFR